MASVDYRWTIPTRYGPATYGLSFATSGKVEVAALPFAALPESVLKLTYGSNWEAVHTYLGALAPTLPHRIRAAILLKDAPPPFGAVVAAYRESILQMGKDGSRPTRTGGMGIYAFGEDEVNDALKRLADSEAIAHLEHTDDRLLDYLQTLLPVASEKTSRLVYGVLRALGTPKAREILLRCLESEGRHPYTPEILQSLASYTSRETLQRLRAVYDAGKFAEDDLEEYLRLLSRFPGFGLRDHLTELLDRHPDQVELIVQAMRSLSMPDASVAGTIREKFDAENHYPVLDRLLRAINTLNVPPFTVDLAAMNRKVDAPAFTEVPPVNWPQQLEPGWRELVRRTSLAAAIAVVTEYLERPEPRLQRNALLQLKVVLSEHELSDPLPGPLESRLRQLLASRYDKVYVEVLNVLGQRNVPLADPAAMLQAVLEIAIGNRYRFVVLTALRRIGDTEPLRHLTRSFLHRQVVAAIDSDRLEQIAAFLPFVEKYLGETAGLRRSLQERLAKSAER
ncbi:hypothetical protein [Neolewinella litorea]|uniref:Uncharacterized protein n=1 Tax=Neolewinella litorea TaxID=2562452 RepID=A0A4S4NQX8_9BACT|nr:hypothetical protein [Neolewinella litorea]THH41575.1 hypothetical protein E4021_02990 [Neolewinella litorea]